MVSKHVYEWALSLDTPLEFESFKQLNELFEELPYTRHSRLIRDVAYMYNMTVKYGSNNIRGMKTRVEAVHRIIKWLQLELKIYKGL